MMGDFRMKGRRTHAALWFGLFVLLGAGCDSLFDTSQDRAENARVRVTGTSPIALQLILSNQFVNVPDPTTGQFVTQLVAADTFDLQLPIDRSYPLGDAERIFVRLTQPDSMQEAHITMRIHLDDREVYQQEATLRNASLEYTFTYQ
jgi:hypothetical protein